MKISKIYDKNEKHNVENSEIEKGGGRSYQE